jgi:hypothetical protein
MDKIYMKEVSESLYFTLKNTRTKKNRQKKILYIILFVSYLENSILNH